MTAARTQSAALAAFFFALSSLLASAAQHTAQGLVLQVDPARRTMVVSCGQIPGYMAAMKMPFSVADPTVFRWLRPGATIRFTMLDSARRPIAQNIQTLVNFEPEPAEAGSLLELNEALLPDKDSKPVEVGQPVPDFELTDQTGATVRLSDFRGKTIALTFGYSRCPYPTYCLRLSRNLEQLEKRFGAEAGRNLMLITVAIDPEYDKGTVLDAYARSFHADPKAWRFLTGPLPEIKTVAASFGMNFWRAEGLLTHSLRTVVIDRDGRLAAQLDGNSFTPQQFGDLVQTVMQRPH